MSAHRTQWSDDHGEPGLRDKFAVYKAADGARAHCMLGGATAYPDGARIGGPGPDDEFVFVLRPESDRAAHDAVRWYARYVEDRDPKLAAELRAQLVRIYRNQEPPTP